MNKQLAKASPNQGKSYNTKPTLKQRRAVENLVENHGNVSKAMIEAGYSAVSAKNPSNLTESKGFMQIANEVGLTDQLIAEALTEDIRLKPQNRVGELALAAKIKGLLIDRQQVEQIQAIRVKFED